MNKYLIYIILALVISVMVAMRSCANQAAEADRLADNQSVLFQKATYYRTKDSLSAASVGRLQLTVAELKAHNSQIVGIADDLGVKLRRLQSASTTALTSSYGVEISTTPRKIKLDNELFKVASDKAMGEALNNTSTARDIAYKSPYITITGTITSDSLYADIHTYDTIVQIVHRVPRRFLFFRWGTKAIRQEVVSKNPHSTITFAEYLELK